MQQIKDALGADALVTQSTTEFERKLAELAEHQRLHGRLPTGSDDRVLGVWLRHRRTEANDGSLSQAHAHRLDTVLGIEWRPEFKNQMVRLPRHYSLWNRPQRPQHAGIVCKSSAM